MNRRPWYQALGLDWLRARGQQDSFDLDRLTDGNVYKILQERQERQERLADPAPSRTSGSAPQLPSVGQDSLEPGFTLGNVSNSFEYAKEVLKDAFISAEIFCLSTRRSIARYNSDISICEVYVALLGGPGFASRAAEVFGIGTYLIVDVIGGRALVLLRHSDEILEGWLIDSEKINLGVLFSVAIPKALGIPSSGQLD